MSTAPSGRWGALRRWSVVNAAVPLALAVAVVATLRSDPPLSFRIWLALGIATPVLAFANLVALPFRWRRSGARSLIAPAVLVVAFLIAVALNFYASDLVLAGTPARPDSYFRGPRPVELEAVASRLLAGERTPRENAILAREGFERVEVDSVLGIVTLGHLLNRTLFEYSWVPGRWPPDFTRPPLAPGAAARFERLRSGDDGPLADPRVSFPAGAPGPLVEGKPDRVPRWAAALLVSLLDGGAVSRAGDGRHLEVRRDLPAAQRSEVAWVQLALEDALDAGRPPLPDHAFDRPLAPHWYLRVR